MGLGTSFQDARPEALRTIVSLEEVLWREPGVGVASAGGRSLSTSSGCGGEPASEDASDSQSVPASDEASD